VVALHRSRYVIAANIKVLEARLRSGLLDERQGRAVTDLLAKARVELYGIDTDSTAGHVPTPGLTTEWTVAQLREQANRWQEAAMIEGLPERAAARLRLAERFAALARLRQARDAACQAERGDMLIAAVPG
jgi:hypothetical protein